MIDVKCLVFRLRVRVMPGCACGLFLGMVCRVRLDMGLGVVVFLIIVTLLVLADKRSVMGRRSFPLTFLSVPG